MLFNVTSNMNAAGVIVAVTLLYTEDEPNAESLAVISNDRVVSQSGFKHFSL